jgi:hypothetical protein
MLRKLQEICHVCYTWGSTSIIPRRWHASINDLNRTKFEEDFLSSHIETTGFQKFLLAVGSAAVSLLDPTRADMIAVMGETAGDCAIKYMLQKMRSDSEGQEILRYFNLNLLTLVLGTISCTIVVRFVVFTVVKTQVEVFWVVTLCDVVVEYHHFRGPCCLHLQGEV